MKTTLYSASLAFTLSGALISAPAYARCPPSLQSDEMIFCIAVEGAGQNYQNYLEELDIAERSLRNAKRNNNDTEKKINAATRDKAAPARSY